MDDRRRAARLAVLGQLKAQWQLEAEHTEADAAARGACGESTDARRAAAARLASLRAQRAAARQVGMRTVRQRARARTDTPAAPPKLDHTARCAA